jgi:hypothetical protein
MQSGKERQMGNVSKAIAGAIVGGVTGIGTVAAGAQLIPDGVTAPWWAYLLVPLVQAAVGFVGVYIAPKNTN